VLSLVDCGISCVWNIPPWLVWLFLLLQFDFEYGYESFHKKAMTQKDAEERKRDEELRKANKK